jgi:UDP-N-acetylmuramoyl-tripeptide--D-alanyl-D-alanine ligase
LYDFIKKRGGKIYYNAANPVLTEMIGNYPNAVSFNTDDGLCKGKIETVYPSLEIIISDKQNSKINLSTNLFGEYNLENLLAAACVGLDLSLSLAEIKNGIEKYYPSNNRSQIIKTGTITFFLDCYNANPSSMQEALLSFSKLESNKKVVILGGMKELGIFSVAEHKKLGKIIESYNFMEIILIGEEFKGLEIFNSKHFDSVLDLKDYFSKIKYSNTHILVKGSRANRLEKILEYFS